MSVFEGEIDYHSTYMVDFIEKSVPYKRASIPKDDDCLVVSLSRNPLKARKEMKKVPDVLCPLEREYYKDAVERFEEDYPKLAKKYMKGELDPIPIDHEIQDLKRTEYLTKYCSRDLPFMSVNLTRRAKALQTIRLPDDIPIPDTTQSGSYRHPPADKYVEHSSKLSLKPKYDNTLQKEVSRILRLRTDQSTYEFHHGLLGAVILENNPFGPPREEPKYGRWKSRYFYTYRL